MSIREFKRRNKLIRKADGGIKTGTSEFEDNKNDGIEVQQPSTIRVAPIINNDDYFTIFPVNNLEDMMRYQKEYEDQYDQYVYGLYGDYVIPSRFILPYGFEDNPTLRKLYISNDSDGFSTTQRYWGDYAYTPATRAYYRVDRIRGGQDAGIYSKSTPKIIYKSDKDNNMNAWDYIKSSIIYNYPLAEIGGFNLGNVISINDDDPDRTQDLDTMSHELAHYYLYLGKNNDPLPEALNDNLNEYIEKYYDKDGFLEKTNEKIYMNYFNNNELSAYLSALKDFTKKGWGDKMTLKDLDSETLRAFANWCGGHLNDYLPWINELSIKEKQMLLDWMNNPHNVVYNKPKQIDSYELSNTENYYT